MGRSLYFAAAVCLFVALSATAQSVSLVPPASPFRIEPGTSFSASTERKPAARELGTASGGTARITSDFTDALDVIRRHHVGGVTLDANELTKSSIGAMLAELDPHSSYFDAADFRTLLGDQQSEYSGTGSTISNFIENGKIETYVIATQRGSAAARADLRYGDRIVSVDGVAVSGVTVDRVRDRVRGPSGSTVRLIVDRAVGGRETIELRRGRIAQPSIPNFFLLRDGTGYVDLSHGFSHTTSAELDAALKDLGARGMKSLILDLRENTGGILDQAVGVAEKFLPAGRMIISQRGRNPFENLTWTSANRRPLNLPLVELINERTASASEVVAGALQDNDRALILGQNTFGKSLVQTVVGLPYGAGLTLTTARYYTPAGRSVQRTYENSGLYDYFNYRLPSTGRDAAKEARTITNRPVFGGGGITPDELTASESFTPQRASLLDPIFFFVRDVIRGKVVGDLVTGGPAAHAGNPQNLDEIDRQYGPLFRSYAQSEPWKIKPALLDNEATFIARQLAYHMTLATRGPDAASRIRIESDQQVKTAISAVPRAAALADSARNLNESGRKKNPARVAFPGGSR